jgi:hypothetical protein
MVQRILLVAVAATLSAIGLSGCSVVASVANSPTQVVYAKWKDAPHTSDPMVTPPAFVPHDAKDIYVQTLPGDRGAILTYRSKQQLDPSLCTSGRLTGRPRLDYNWWPDTKPPAEGTRCSPGWRVFGVKGVTYAWRD